MIDLVREYGVLRFAGMTAAFLIVFVAVVLIAAAAP